MMIVMIKTIANLSLKLTQSKKKPEESSSLKN